MGYLKIEGLIGVSDLSRWEGPAVVALLLVLGYLRIVARLPLLDNLLVGWSRHTGGQIVASQAQLLVLRVGKLDFGGVEGSIGGSWSPAILNALS